MGDSWIPCLENGRDSENNDIPKKNSGCLAHALCIHKLANYNFQLLLLVAAKIFWVVLGCFMLVVRITQLHKSWTEVFYLVPLVPSLIVDFTLTFTPGLDYEPQTPEDTPMNRVFQQEPKAKWNKWINRTEKNNKLQLQQNTKNGGALSLPLPWKNNINLATRLSIWTFFRCKW